MTSRDKQPPGPVLDPKWEDALRAGQEADGGAGSVEDELAVVRLMLHAREPESLPDEALDRIWSDIEPEVAPAPWWRRPWVLWGAPAVAAAAVLVVLVIPRGDDPVPDDAALAAAESPAEALRKQFLVLEPAGREALDRSVERGRSTLRGQLLASARRAGSGSVGGAP